MTESDKPSPSKPSSTPSGAESQGESVKPWLDRSSTHDRIFYALLSVCAGLLVTDLLYHKHAHFDYESWFGFYAGFGFLAYCSIVFTAKLLRRVVKRKEDYYD